MSNKTIAITSINFIAIFNGILIATGSVNPLLHYILGLGFCIPLAYKIGKGE